MTTTATRSTHYPFAVLSELRDAANEHGYRIGPEQAGGWLFFRSATAPGEIAVAATDIGLDGPLFLSLSHPGAARELDAEVAAPPANGHSAAFVFLDRDALFKAVSDVYRLSVSLPTQPLEEYLADTAGLGDTELEKIQKIRIGQERFREALMVYWNRRCPITGISEPELLRASHIIPWAECDSDAERLNLYNGLLLSSLWDAAFDAGLLTFDNDGRAMPSPLLGSAAIAKLEIGGAPVLSLTPEHRARLTWHRQNRWRKR